MTSDALATLSEWLTSFGRVLIRPNTQTFVGLADRASGKFPAAIAWLVVYALIYYGYVVLVVGTPLRVDTLFLLVLALPFGVMAWATAVHLVYQKFFRRKIDRHLELIYALTCVFIVASLLGLLLGSLPVVGEWLVYASWVYTIWLAFLATKAITKLGTAQAVIAVLFGSILGISSTICGVLFFFSLSGTNARIFGP